MKTSPFPGMGPYLESHWGDVHTTSCVAIRTDLQPRLPRGLRARANEHVRLLAQADDGYLIRPILTSRWVGVVDTGDGGRVVTVIEVLSPGNKASGDLNKSYRDKVKQYIAAGVNVVEIDLLQSTRERLAVPMLNLLPARWSAYCTCVNRVSDPSVWEAYPMPLRDPLPTVPVPCREGEDDVPLALQPILDRAYAWGGHDDIDYTAPLEPPLSPADAAWAAGLTAGRTGEP